MVWCVVVLAVLGGGGYPAWRWMRAGSSAVSYRTVPVAKGDLLATIGATGSLEPEEAIDVGAQVAGQISQFGTEGGKPGAKPIDRCSFVKTGDLLAQIDPSLYKMDLESAEAQLAQSNAELAQRKAQLSQNQALLAQSEAQLAQSDAQLTQSDASIVKAQADIQQMEAKKTQGEQDWKRAQQLSKEAPDAQTEAIYDGFKAAYLTAVANVASANALKVQADAAKIQARASRVQVVAAIEQAKAAVEQAKAAIDQAEATIKQTKAAVKRAQRNLDYCTITSPVDGVVIDRRVNIGQTVVSSLNAPSLFLIAKDLTRMQIWVSVNEADIGSIHNEQPVTFTVDARPGKTFVGKVTKVRFDATMTQNVVTYPVEVLALNPDGLLYPYMTANVQFELDKRTDVMKVPNAALAYAPMTEDQVAPESRPEMEKLAQRNSSREASQSGDGPKKGREKGLLWVQQGEFLRPISVRVGMSDGTMTEVENPELKARLEVVVSEQRQSATTPGGTSPFLPAPRKR
jgi:HlyD family secretion protein